MRCRQTLSEKILLPKPGATDLLSDVQDVAGLSMETSQTGDQEQPTTIVLRPSKL